MGSFQNDHIFTQGGDFSQLTGGFPPEEDSRTGEEEYNVQETQTLHGNTPLETMSSRAEAICEENRQINRFVELSLKQLEKKRIKLMNKDKTVDEEKANLLEIHKRQSEHSLELQMNVEEWSTKYENELKERDKVIEKLEQVEYFISKYDQNLAQGTAVGEQIEKSNKLFQSEFENIGKKAKTNREKITRMRASVTADLEEIAKKCKDLKNEIIINRENMVGEIQSLHFQNEEMTNKINGIVIEIEKSVQKKEDLTKSCDEIVMDHKVLNGSIAKIDQELNEAKTVNASRIQHLKIQINTEENINQNLETNLKEKEKHMHNLTRMFEESTNLSNQVKNAVEVVKSRVEKKVKEINLYKNKQPVLSNQASSLVETLKKYENVENENKHFKESISLLEEEIKSNIEILSKKDVLHELTNEVNRLEKNLNNLEGNKLELEKKIENARKVEHKLTSSVKKDKILYQQEREKKLEQNETLKQVNIELASDVAELTLKIEELYNLNENAKEKGQKMRSFIESSEETVRINEEKYFTEEEEQMKLIKKYTEKLNEIQNYLNRNEFFILEANPKQRELSMMLERKESLEKEIMLLYENHQNKISTLQNNHRAKIQGMENEMEKHSSIMKNIQKDQEEATEKLKAEIKKEEEPKPKLENELRMLFHKLKSLKNEEIMKRNKVAKMEKRQQAIMKEIKVTRNDIVHAVTGKPQDSQTTSKRTRLMTPSSSAGSFHSLYGRVDKTVQYKENRPSSVLAPPDSKQESTRKWIQSVPEDDFDFSEI